MSKTPRRWTRRLSIFLSAALGLNLISTPIVSAAPGQSERAVKKQTPQADIGDLPNKLPASKLELTRKRTKYSTRYLNPDGTFTEEIFLEPQFYQDETDHKWKKIDKTLKSSSAKGGSFTNAANDFASTFASASGNGELVTVEENGKGLGLIPAGAKTSKATVKSDEVTYPELFPNADVRYRVLADGVKEDIILKSYTPGQTFSFEMSLRGIKEVVQADGTIVFQDAKGQILWSLAKPYMVDANGKYSDQVQLKLRKAGGKTYVDVVADEAFLKDSTTRYPVTIDPTINSWDVIRDQFISSTFPASVYSAEAFMNTGAHTYYGATRSLLQLYLPSLPSASKIQSATFNAYQNKTDSTTATVELYRVNSDWLGTATWNTQPAIGAQAESAVTSSTSQAYWQWYITPLVKDWYQGKQPNYGIMLKQQNETTSTYRSFNTVNSSNNTPRLSITYSVDGIGFEDYWTNTTDEVNPANGNLALRETDVSVAGRGFTTDVTRTYNSRSSETAGTFGYGWSNNLDARLIDAGTGPITFIDGDGTSHFFGQNPSGGYTAHGGVNVDLTKNADGTYTLEQPDSSKLHFNTAGRLASMVDSAGNKSTLSYGTDGKLLSVTKPGNLVTTFSYTSTGHLASVTDPAKRSVSYGYDTQGNLVTVTDQAGYITSYTYDANHNLLTEKDARGNTTTYAYDTSDRVSSVSRPITINGTRQISTVTYAYNPAYSVTSVTDAEGRRVDYSYNANGNIVQTTENPLDEANKAVVTYAYDNNNNLTQVIHANANKAGTGETYVYTYDADGNITSVKEPLNQTAYYTYDTQNNLTREQDPNGNLNDYDYDDSNNQTEAIDSNTQTVASRYASNGNMLYDTHSMSAADNQISNSSFELDKTADNWPDGWWNATETGKTATFGLSSISKFGNKSISISNPTGWAVVMSNSLIPYTTGQSYVVSGYVKTAAATGKSLIKLEFLTSTDDWLGQHTSYTLVGTNDWTRIQASIDKVPANTAKIRVSVGLEPGTGTAYFDGIQLEKGSVLSAYNLVDNSSMERDTNQDLIPDNWEVSSNVVANDKLVSDAYVGSKSFQLTGEAGKNKFIKQRIVVSGDANTPMTLSGWSKQEGANINGGLYQVQVAVNHTDGTIDWSNANYFSKTRSGWQHVSAEVKPTKPFQSIDVFYYYYNQTGTAWFDAIRMEMGASHTFYGYDATGNYTTSVKNPLGRTITYNYDEAGNRIGITDSKGKQTTFAYDALNRLTSLTDANLGVTKYSYDGMGNTTSVTNAKSAVTTYAYDEFDNVSKITNPLNQSIVFGYNKNGSLTNVTYPNGNTVSSSLNAMNRIDNVSYNGVKQWAFTYDANGNTTSITHVPTGKVTSYIHDKNDRITEQATGQNRLSYGYDNNSNLATVTATAGSTSLNTQYEYNSLNQVTTLTQNGVRQGKFIYDERGNLISTMKGNKTYTASEYDDTNRIKSVKNYDASGNLLDSYVYGYDESGNIASVTTRTNTIQYQFDALNQLTKETLNDGTTIAYEYDSVGNRTRKTVTKGTTSTVTTYSYDLATQLTAVNGQAYSYDANGNLLADGTKTYSYDAENRLVEVKTKAGVSLATFAYDKDGNRIQMSTPAGTTNYTYSGDKVLYETDAAGTITASYTWDAEGNPLTLTKNGVTYYYHLNGHGDVTKLTDANGAVAAEYEYDAWGNIISQSGQLAASNPYRYAGYRYDEATGLYYLSARHYDANTGRFTTRDTVTGAKHEPLSQHLYLYTHNNPVMFTDPSGNIIPLIVGGAVAAEHLIAVGMALSATGAIVNTATLVKNNRKNNDPKTGIIYLRTVKNGKNIGAKYVGKTNNNETFKKRRAAHDRNGKKAGEYYKYSVLKDRIKLSELRYWEQYYINKHGGKSKLQNKINSIAPKYWKDLGLSYGETKVKY
ncbi:DNRLRE domain-containing protein [Brevibacillus dissolubilis]|uniref:DNRLRE domain-containing protein n=1 Tax=Brevibacillus dissolubilis TaxID=1844116 RepID=UPI0011174CF9|nr:DNRLRE domain-containing protein [Brevibacillus dissolubilis]